MFFNSPTDVVEKHVEPGTRIRLGGLVKPGSVVRGDNLAVRFEVTDGKTVDHGRLSGAAARPVPRRAGRGGRRRARRRPASSGPTACSPSTTRSTCRKEVADALKKQGHWKDDEASKTRPAPCSASQGTTPVIAELGHFALVLALGLALVQASVPIYGARKNDPVLMGVAGPTAVAQFCFVAIAFAALIACYVRSDFSVVNVFENSHSAKPLIYKITGVWGNHEGSMLLWVLILSAVRRAGRGVRRQPAGAAARPTCSACRRGSRSRSICSSWSPRTRSCASPTPPVEGRDLNPILQDPGLAIHPPLLYLGYVGFSISFSFAIAALIEGRIDAAWARWVRPWTLLAWMFLTLGIAMGSYWAYYALGWGGWWFWDPVENASLMPWLAGTALLHSAVVMEKRDALKVWTILLAILAFSLSLIGTFLVRSGVLTSVHAFATDPTRGVFILAILVLFIGGGARAVRLARAAAEAGRPVRADLARGRAGAQQPVPGDAPARRCSSARSIRSRSRR